MNGPYDEILHLPHPTSKKHPRMSMADRAAQFSPFAALTGFGGVIQETGRLTRQRVELGESDQEELERRLNWLDAWVGEHPPVKVTYFLPDEKKEGGAYVTVQDRLKRIDTAEGLLLLEGGGRVPLEEIQWIEAGEEVQ